MTGPQRLTRGLIYCLTYGLARGLTAAVRSAAVVDGAAFGALLQPPPPGRAAPTDDPALARVAISATRVAFVALRLLQRLPRWRNTCLYRAVAECLVLRGLGMPATLRLGVARAVRSATGRPTADTVATRATVVGAIAAHAWVDCPGHRCRTTHGREAEVFATLRQPACAPAAHLHPPVASA